MKKLNNKKGFTIVELVIVIAVIAILAAVLIPTFSNVVNKANESKALQEARNLYVEYAVDHMDDLNEADGTTADVIIKVTVSDTDYYFSFIDGEMSTTPLTTAPVTSSTGTEGTAYYTASTETGFTNVYIYTGTQTAE